MTEPKEHCMHTWTLDDSTHLASAPPSKMVAVAFVVAVGAVFLATTFACDTTVPTTGKACVSDVDCEGESPHYCAPTSPPICVPGEAVAPRENRPPIVQSAVVVAQSGETITSRILAVDPDPNETLSYRLVFSTGTTGILFLVEPDDGDDVEPGTFTFQATTDLPLPVLSQAFEVVVTDSQGAEGKGTVFTAVIDNDAVKTFTGDSSTSLEDDTNWSPVDTPTATDAVFFPGTSANAPLDAGDVEMGPTFIAGAVSHDLTGAKIFGPEVFSASAGTGTMALDDNATVAGVFPSLRIARGIALVGATDAESVFVANAGDDALIDRVDLRSFVLSTRGDFTQTVRGAPIVMARSEDQVPEDGQVPIVGLTPTLVVGRDLRLDGGANEFDAGNIFLSRSLFVSGRSFRPTSRMTLTFPPSGTASEIRMDATGQSHLPTTVVEAGATVTVLSNLAIKGDLDVDGAFSVFSGSTATVDGTLRLRRNFSPGNGPFGQLRANACDISPFVETPSWVFCLNVGPADAGEPDPVEPDPVEPDPVEPNDGGGDGGDGGDGDAGGLDDGGNDAGVPLDGGNDAGVPLDGGDDAGFPLDGGNDAGAPGDGGVDGGPLASIPPCVLVAQRDPGFVTDLFIVRLGVTEAPTIQIDVDTRSLTGGNFSPIDAAFGNGDGGGRIQLDASGSMSVTPPSLGVETEVGIEYRLANDEIRHGCVSVLVVDGEAANTSVLTGTTWSVADGWAPTGVPANDRSVVVDSSVSSVSDVIHNGLIAVTTGSLLSGDPGAQQEAGLYSNGSLRSAGTTNGGVHVSGFIRGNFDELYCNDLVTFDGNVNASTMITSGVSNPGPCTVRLGPNRLTASGNVQILGQLVLESSFAVLDVRGNLTVQPMGQAHDLTAGTIFAGGDVTLSGATGGNAFRFIADGTGDQALDIGQALEANLIGAGTAIIDPPLTVSGTLFIDQPIEVETGGLVIPTHIAFGPNFTFDPEDNTLNRIQTGSCDDGAFTTANPASGEPCSHLDN